MNTTPGPQIPQGRFREALEYLEARGALCIRAEVTAGTVRYRCATLVEAKAMAADFSFRGVPATYEITIDPGPFAAWLAEQRQVGADLDWELLGVPK